MERKPSGGGKAGGSDRPGVGVGVVVRRGEEILLVRRKHHGEGSWSTPGGYLDPGESFEECAARETREETGVEISEAAVVGLTNDLHDDGKHNVTVWLAAEHAAGEARIVSPDELTDVGWFSPSALPAPLYRSTRNFFEGRSYPPEAARNLFVRDSRR